VQQADGTVLITNDGATLLNKMHLDQPAAKMLVELARSQDAAAGDGTTSVTVLCGALLRAALTLLESGVHPTLVSDAFGRAAARGAEELAGMSTPVSRDDREALVRAASTSLSSKVVHAYSALLSPMAVDAVLRVSDLDAPEAADLADVRVVSKLGGTLDDSRLVEGLVLDLPAAKGAGGPSRVENARVALIQYQLSPPKSDMENNVVVGDYAAMDRILKEERAHILAAVKRVRAAGCNVLLVQKSILRDAVSDMALHYLAKAKIMVVRDVERDDVEFISKTLGLAPVAHPDALLPERLAHVGLVEEIEAGRSRVVQLTGIQSRGRTATILLRASNSMVLEEAHRSLHDALCA
ncbi:TCP-1/cpn60 chaperonin, partial [Helicosporidium sp. ATCC 50920]